VSSKVIPSNFGMFASPERSPVFGLYEASLEAVKAGGSQPGCSRTDVTLAATAAYVSGCTSDEPRAELRSRPKIAGGAGRH